MLEIHAFATPNSVKVVIAAEEMGLPYRLIPIDLRRGEQRSDAFVTLNPHGKVPVLTDRAAATCHDVVLSESAAILVYLAEKTEKLLPADAIRRSKVFEQLFFHASGLSPAFLQAFLLRLQKEPKAEAQEASRKEIERVLTLLDKTLENHPFVAGGAYTIADIAHFGWIWRHEALGVDLERYTHVKRWYESVFARPAVVTAIANTTALSR